MTSEVGSEYYGNLNKIDGGKKKNIVSLTIVNTNVNSISEWIDSCLMPRRSGVADSRKNNLIVTLLLFLL